MGSMYYAIFYANILPGKYFYSFGRYCRILKVKWTALNRMGSKTAPGYITHKIGHWGIPLKEQINIILKASMIMKQTSLRIKGNAERVIFSYYWTWKLQWALQYPIIWVAILQMITGLTNAETLFFKLLQTNDIFKQWSKKNI